MNINYKKIPSTLKPFVNHEFSSGSYTGNDFDSFNIKFKNAIKKSLPDGYTIHSWNKGHYECSGVIKNHDGKFIYLSIPDVRYFPKEWITNILIRTMKHDRDWTGGCNQRTTLYDLGNNIKKLYS